MVQKYTALMLAVSLMLVLCSPRIGMANAPQTVHIYDLQAWVNTNMNATTNIQTVAPAFVRQWAATFPERRVYAVMRDPIGGHWRSVVFFATSGNFILSHDAGASSASGHVVEVRSTAPIAFTLHDGSWSTTTQTSFQIVNPVTWSSSSNLRLNIVEVQLEDPLRAIALWRNNIWEDLATTAFIGPVQPITFTLPQALELSVHGFARVELRTIDNQILHNAAVPADRIVDIPMTAIPSWFTLSDLRIIGFTTMGQTVVNPAHVWQLPIMATIPLASGQIVSPIHGQAITVGPTQPISVTVTHGATSGAEWKVRSWDVSRQVAREHVLAPSGTNRMSTSMTGLQSGRHAIALVAIITGVEQTVSRIEIDVIQQIAGQEPIEPIPSPIPPPPQLGENATLIDRVIHGFEVVIYWITLPFIGIANMVTAITSALGNLVSNTGGFFAMFNMIWGFFPPEIRTGFAVMTPLLLVLWAVKR